VKLLCSCGTGVQLDIPCNVFGATVERGDDRRNVGAPQDCPDIVDVALPHPVEAFEGSELGVKQ